MPKRARIGPTPSMIETAEHDWRRHQKLFGVGEDARWELILQEVARQHPPPPPLPAADHLPGSSAKRNDGQPAPSDPHSLGALPLEIFLMIADRAGMIPTLNLGLTCKSFYLHLRHFMGPGGLIIRLKRATSRGTEAEVRDLLRFVNPNGGRMLLEATHFRSIDIIPVLLEAGVDPNERDINNYTSLHFAASAGYEKKAKWLLGAQGIDKNAKTDVLGWTPLHFAVYKNQKDLVTLLCKHKVDIDAIDTMGCTALHLAYIYRHNSIKTILIENNASNRIYDNLGVHPSGYFFKCNRLPFHRVFSVDISNFAGGYYPRVRNRQ